MPNVTQPVELYSTPAACEKIQKLNSHTDSVFQTHKTIFSFIVSTIFAKARILKGKIIFSSTFYGIFIFSLNQTRRNS